MKLKLFNWAALAAICGSFMASGTIFAQSGAGEVKRTQYTINAGQACATGYINGVTFQRAYSHNYDEFSQQCLNVEALGDAYITDANENCISGYIEGEIFTRPMSHRYEPAVKNCLKR